MNYLQKQATLNKLAQTRLAVNYILRNRYMNKLAFTPYGEYDPDDLPKRKPRPSKDKFSYPFKYPKVGKPIPGKKQYDSTINFIKNNRKLYPWATPTHYFFRPDQQVDSKFLDKFRPENREAIKQMYPDNIVPPDYYTLVDTDAGPRDVGVYTGSEIVPNNHEEGHWYANNLISKDIRKLFSKNYNPASISFNPWVYEDEYPAVAQQLDTALRMGKSPIDDTVYFYREFLPAKFMENMPAGADTFGTTKRNATYAWTPGLDNTMSKTKRNFRESFEEEQKDYYPEVYKDNHRIIDELNKEMAAIDPTLSPEEQTMARYEALMKVHPSLYNMTRRGNLSSYMRANNDFNDPTDNYQKRKDIADAYSYLRENFKNWDGDGIDEPRMNPRLWRVMQRYQVDPNLDTNLPRNILPLDQLNNMKNEVDLIQKASPHLDTTHGFLPTA